MKNIICTIALSVLFVTSSIAAEAGNDKGKHCKKRAAMKEKILEKYDSNSDGKLDETERAAAKAGAKDRRQARVEKLKSEKPELFAKIDANSDGKISKDEAQAARKARAGKGDKKDGKKCDGSKKDRAERIAKMKSEKPELFAKLDKNSDGKLSKDEIQRARQMRKSRSEGKGERSGKGERKQRQN